MKVWGCCLTSLLTEAAQGDAFKSSHVVPRGGTEDSRHHGAACELRATSLGSQWAPCEATALQEGFCGCQPEAAQLSSLPSVDSLRAPHAV